MAEKIIADADETETDLKGGPFIPLSTVWCHANKEKMVATNYKCEDIDLFSKQLRSVSHHGLTTPEQRKFLQNAVCLSDRANNEMARKEGIDIIVDMYGAKTRKQVENHLGYLIKYRQINDLKEGGRLICAQNNTTKLSCIHVEQQLWWYMVVQFTWDQLKHLNMPKE